jgi:hypothetical protein
MSSSLNEKIGNNPSLQSGIKEPVNHILVLGQLLEMAKNDVAETMGLQLHSNVMNGLLTNVEEGLSGEYSKVSIHVSEEGVHRSQFTNLTRLMKTMTTLSFTRTSRYSCSRRR